MTSNYHPEPYWNDVAKRIAARPGSKLLAGDDEPYYQYKRQQFLKLLHALPFRNKTVLEAGCGPGGNLLEIDKQQPQTLCGVDISEAMVTLAKEATSGRNIQIKKVDGVALPFATDSFDVALTSTVLQHNTDAQMAERLIAEMCRVTKGDIYIFERIERTIKGTELCVGRPVAYYQSLFSKHQFALVETRFLNIHVSYFVAGVIRKLCNGRTKKEGAPTSALCRFFQNSMLPLTALLDPLVPLPRELALLHFIKQK